jgi:hypothetical protein
MGASMSVMGPSYPIRFDFAPHIVTDLARNQRAGGMAGRNAAAMICD